VMEMAKGWKTEELKVWLDEQFAGNSVLVLDFERAKEVVERFNNSYKGDETNILRNVAQTFREKFSNYKVSVKDGKIIVYKKAEVNEIRTAENKTAETEITTTEKASNGVKILPVKAEDYLPKNVPNYVQRDYEDQLFMAHMESGIPLLLVGPKGVGKTLSIAAFAAKNSIPIIQFDCSENTKRQDLIGRFLLIGDEVVYELGVMPTAITVANVYGKAILVFEEINALTPQMQKVLNQLLDWRRHVYIPELGKIYKLENGTKLLIVGTMNPSYYGGVHELNEDLRSRFAEVYIDYPNDKQESEILEKTTNIDPDLRKLLITLAIETRNGFAIGELSYALSTRDLAMFARVYESYKSIMNEKEALKLALRNVVLNRYEDTNEKSAVKQRIFSIFGVELR